MLPLYQEVAEQIRGTGGEAARENMKKNQALLLCLPSHLLESAMAVESELENDLRICLGLDVRFF